jgi:hypothetical protein
MIITRKKDEQQLLKSVCAYERIFLVGCGECSTTCSTGGLEEVERMAAFLTAHRKTVTGTCVPKAPCVAAQVKTEIAQHTAEVRQADCVLVLACGLGVQSLKENNRAGQPVIPALDTVCGAVVEASGTFKEKCSMCGECMLAETAGICPITLCAKSLANGPCGGVSKGKCEVDRDKDCVWVLIYNELTRTNALAAMRATRAARDFRKAGRPHALGPRQARR